MIIMAEHLHLLLLYRKSRVEKKAPFFCSVVPVCHKESCHSSHHRSNRGNTTLRFYVKVEKKFYEFRGFLLKGLYVFYVRINRSHTSFECFYLCFNRKACAGKSRFAHLHSYESDSGCFFDQIDKAGNLPYACPREGNNPAFTDHFLHNPPVRKGIFHLTGFYCFIHYTAKDKY